MADPYYGNDLHYLTNAGWKDFGIQKSNAPNPVSFKRHGDCTDVLLLFSSDDIHWAPVTIPIVSETAGGLEIAAQVPNGSLTDVATVTFKVTVSNYSHTILVAPSGSTDLSDYYIHYYVR